ncbi:MAG: tyrosine-type recombinase/integrase [Roseburia sp.]
MKIEKLPSGSYRIRKMYKGKMYTVIFDYKPTQKEAMQAMSAELDKISSKKQHLTFREAAKQYTETKEHVLSPKTVKEYLEIPSRFSDSFSDKLISDITQIDIQKEINLLAKTLSPKTVRNYHGFISSVFGMFRPEFNISTTLPQKVKNEPYIPSDNDVRRLLEAAKGSMFEIPIMLGCYGLRRSEICSLTLDDIKGNTITIDSAKVLDKDNHWVEKQTKTTASTREVVISPQLADLIRKQGYVYNGHPNSISKYMNKLQDKLDMPHFSIHKLRHYFASSMSALNIPEVDILEMGGWETDYVMKNIYRHSMKDKLKKSQTKASDALEKTLF